jgi:asparagine synthase (glutamine-hydrolysing)
MSALFGVVSKRGKPDPLSLQKIKHTIKHRNVDGAGFWEDEWAALGFMKMAVYPRQLNEHLPLQEQDVVITADARIDNRDQLLALLRLNKKQWDDAPDSTLILKAYLHWGEKCVEHLDGEYAFAIWNKVTRKLFMATDHIGYRPVYYYNGPDEFVFCSESKGVIAAKPTPHYFNNDSLIEYHFGRNSPETYTREVFLLCGATVLTFADDKLEVKKYWEPGPTGKYAFKKDEEWTDCLRDLLFKAIEKRFNPEAPVGITLSGGLDSTSIACILSEFLQKKNKPLYAFSSVLPKGYKGVERDERKFIEFVNQKCPNIVQMYIEAPGAGPFQNVDTAFFNDERLPNYFHYMDNAILEAAKEKNVRTLFSGYGGDLWVSWKGNSVIHQLIAKGHLHEAIHIIYQMSRYEKKVLLSTFVREVFRYQQPYRKVRSMFRNQLINWQVYTILKNSFTSNYYAHTDPSMESDNRRYMTELISGGRMGSTMGLFINRAAGYQIQSCDPMFDRHINEFMFEVPIHLFVKNGVKRALLRNAMHNIIPPEIQWRRDKLPYSPGFQKRIINSKELIFDLLKSDESAFAFEKYFSRDRITQHINKIVPEPGFTQSQNVVAPRIMQATIAIIILTSLKAKGYLFE